LAAWIALLVLLGAELMDMIDQSSRHLTALPAIQESTGAGPARCSGDHGYSLPIAVG